MNDAGDALSVTWPGSGRQAQRRWDRLTDADVEGIAGRCPHLVSRLQERYGYSRERAEREAQAFVDELDAAITPGRRVAAERSMPSGNARAPGSPTPQSRTSRTSSAPPPEAAGPDGSAGSAGTAGAA